MPSYHPTLVCECGVKDCGNTQTFDNPEKQPDYLLDAKAVNAGWYLANFGGGGHVMCPPCHAAAAAKAGVASFHGLLKVIVERPVHAQPAQAEQASTPPATRKPPPPSKTKPAAEKPKQMGF